MGTSGTDGNEDVMEVRVKRIYDEPAPDDGRRILVDRLWPRGVAKEEAELDDWVRDIAPSDELRSWFDHDPERWDEFTRRYRDELEGSSAVAELRSLAKRDRVTLLYAASDREHNNAVALKGILETDRRNGDR